MCDECREVEHEAAREERDADAVLATEEREEGSVAWTPLRQRHDEHATAIFIRVGRDHSTNGNTCHEEVAGDALATTTFLRFNIVRQRATMACTKEAM